MYIYNWYCKKNIVHKCGGRGGFGPMSQLTWGSLTVRYYAMLWVIPSWRITSTASLIVVRFFPGELQSFHYRNICCLNSIPLLDRPFANFSPSVMWTKSIKMFFVLFLTSWRIIWWKSSCPIELWTAPHKCLNHGQNYNKLVPSYHFPGSWCLQTTYFNKIIFFS